MTLWGRTFGSEPHCTQGRRAGLPGRSNSGPRRHTATHPATAGVRAVARLSSPLKVCRWSATSMVAGLALNGGGLGPRQRAAARLPTVCCPFRFLARPSDASGRK
jgi:hypothetical protein